MGARGGVSAHRHRSGLRQRGRRRARAPGERDPAGAGLHHDEVRPVPQRPGGGARAQPRAAGGRAGRPLPGPQPPRRAEVGLAGHGASPRARADEEHRGQQLRRQPARQAGRLLHRSPGRQPGPVQPLPVPPPPGGGLPKPRDRARGLQPADARRRPRRSSRRRCRRPGRPDPRPGAAALGAAARRDRDPEVHASGSHPRELRPLRLHDRRRGHGPARRPRSDRRSGAGARGGVVDAEGARDAGREVADRRMRR